MHRKMLLAVAVAFTLFIAGCAPAAPAVAPATPVPTQEPTDTPIPVLALPPTETPPPTATATPAPTDTPLPTATNTATPLPTATPTPATETSVVFADDYGSTCRLLVDDTADHTRGCEGGEYVILSKVANKSWGALYPDSYDDFVLETDARVASGAGPVGYGLWLRSARDGKAYVLSFYTEGAYALEVYDGKSWKDVIPYTKTGLIKGGNEKNRIKVVAQGKQMVLYLNGQFLDTVTDSTVASGRVGYMMVSDDANVKVAFDNLTISKINRLMALPTPKDRPPAPTPLPTIPAGMGGLMVTNYYGQDMNIDVAGKLYKVPANGTIIIHLPPGKYNWSADIPGLGRAGATVEIVLGRYYDLPFAARK